MSVKNSIARARSLERGRELLRKQAWSSAFSQLVAADREAPLEPMDLVELGQAAYLIGKDVEGSEFLARAHQGFLSRGEVQPATRCAFWLGFTLLVNGEQAHAGGWLARAERLLEGHPDCPERGYLQLPSGYRRFHQGDPATAYKAFAEAVQIGERFGDTDLVTLARQGQGRALIRQGEIARGVSLLDEAMVAVIAGEVSPLASGGVYCSVIDACSEIFDLRRAQEWTSALHRWCASQPDIVPYRGQCLIHRAEILQLHGAWPEALEEARQACERFTQPTPRAAAGAAFYRLAELHRLRGEFAEAEEAYGQASRWLTTPQSGLAELRLVQGQLEAAKTAISRVVDETQDLQGRARVLHACVEIMLAAKDIPAARTASNELAGMADHFNAPLLQALATCCEGAVLLAEGEAKRALLALRQSWAMWCELGAPYESARVRTLIAAACRDLGDGEAADQELRAAREVFRQVGAAPDLARAELLLKAQEADGPDSLTVREVEVLKLVAAGKTNRAIADRLNISEKTVARHMSNIFNKLDLSSRSAATAYAYQHELV